jgi:hypothetical protein
LAARPLASYVFINPFGTAAAAKLDVILFTGLTVPGGAICGNPAGSQEIAFFFTQNIWMYSTMISDTMGSAGFGTLCPG